MVRPVDEQEVEGPAGGLEGPTGVLEGAAGGLEGARGRNFLKE